MTRFVLDCSATMAWLFGESAEAIDALERLSDSEAVVPDLWRLEVANVLLVAERRRRITAEQSDRFISAVANLNVTVVPESLLRGMGDLVRLGRRHELSAYDAAYLDLADRFGLSLCTLDRKLASAAEVIGVRLMIDAGRSGEG